MVEVFKTDIKNKEQADLILNAIHAQFAPYIANFDLDDCDNILRVKCMTHSIDPVQLSAFLITVGCHAELLK